MGNSRSIGIIPEFPENREVFWKKQWKGQVRQLMGEENRRCNKEK